MIKLWKIVLPLALLSLPLASLANSPVWKVSKAGESIFLGGTVHVLSQNDYPLPKAFETAYEQASILVLEMDMSKAQGLEFQQAMLKKMTFQDKRTYADVLKPETVTSLNSYMNERGIPVANLQKFKPALLSITLTMIELNRLGLGGTGVDAFYSQRGLNDNKSFLFLELPEEQIDYLANMGKGYEDELINYTLKDMATLPTVMQEMKDAWRIGDNSQLYEVGGKEWQEKFPTSYQQLIVARNNNWLPHLESYFNTPEVELVLVGAMHLVGKNGVIEQLQSRGYTVTQL